MDFAFADEHFAVGAKFSPLKKEASRSGEIAAFGGVMESAKGKESRIEFEAKVAIEVVIDERSYALEPLAALIG